MRITDLLDKRSIAFDKNPANKQETLDMAVDLMCASGKINDTEAYRKQVYLREEESTTGIGEGIAIPHGKGDCVSKPGLAAMVIKNGVDFDSLDGEPVTLLFLIAAPNTEDNVHLEVLSKLSMMLMDEQFTEALRNATSAEEFLSIIDKADDGELTLMSSWQIQEMQRVILRSLQLQLVLQVSHIHIWQQKESRKQQKLPTVS